MTENQKPTEKRIITDLKAAGWVKTTLGECRVGDEVMLNPAAFPRVLRVTQTVEWAGEKGPLVNISDGGARWGTTPVLRSPRLEYAPGTVAMIRWRGGKSIVRALKVSGQWVPPSGIPLDDEGVEVVRVLLPAEQDTPPIEVTDEMVERAAKARYLASYEGDTFSLEWDELCERFPEVVYLYRREVRAAIEAALGKEK